MRYLTEGNYEEAILMFTAVIEIDDKLPDAYIGRGDAYVALADYEKALADYEKAVDLGAEGLDKRLEQVKLMLESYDLLAVLYDNFNMGKIETAKDLMRQEEYINMAAMLNENYLYYDNDDDTVLTVYPDNLYYFGQWLDGQRNGEGLWIKAVFDESSSDESMIYDGLWKNDKPNGKGTVTENYKTRDHVGGISYAVKIVTEGNFVNGLSNGVIHQTWYMDDGYVLSWTITTKEGAFQPLSNIPAEVKESSYYSQTIDEGKYLVSLMKREFGYSYLWGYRGRCFWFYRVKVYLYSRLFIVLLVVSGSVAKE